MNERTGSGLGKSSLGLSCPFLSNQASISKYELSIVHQGGPCVTSSVSAWEMVIAPSSSFWEVFFCLTERAVLVTPERALAWKTVIGLTNSRNTESLCPREQTHLSLWSCHGLREFNIVRKNYTVTPSPPYQCSSEFLRAAVQLSQELETKVFWCHAA